MSDFVSGVVGKFSFSVTWIFAAAVATGAGSVFLLPTAARLGFLGQVTRLPAAASVLFFTLVVTAVGMVMGIVSTPLYQLLEGYKGWPRSFRRMGLERQRRRLCALQEELDELEDGEELEVQLLLDRLSHYPTDEDQIAPTRFGNAMRALEMYGFDHYQLDSLTLWSELYAVVPKSVQDEVAGSRVGIDFFVAMFYLTFAYGLAAIGLFVVEAVHDPHRIDPALLIEGLVVLFVGPLISYRGAISATDYYASTVQAMVNLGRPKLAEALSLNMPSSLAEERIRMWDVLRLFVNEPDNGEAIDILDTFRAGARKRSAAWRLLHGHRRPALQTARVRARTCVVTPSSVTSSRRAAVLMKQAAETVSAPDRPGRQWDHVG